MSHFQKNKLLHECIEKQVIKDSNKIAVIYRGAKKSYKEIWNDINNLKDVIMTNLPEQSRVGLMVDNSYESIVCMYSIFLAGLICVPIDTDMSQKNLLYIFKDASIRLLILNKKYLSKILNLQNQFDFGIVFTEHDENKMYNSVNGILSNKNKNMAPHRLVNFKNDSTAVILYTTGTTGRQKGVMLSHNNLLSATRSINKFMRINSSAIESIAMRLSHSFGFARLRSVLDVGGTVVIENGLINAGNNLINIGKYKVNGLGLVPLGFEILLTYFKEEFKKISTKIKYIEIGSSEMKLEHKKLLIKLCPEAKICMHYGLTEASRSTFIEFNKENKKLDTIGKPSPAVDIKIVDEFGKKVKSNKPGFIAIKSPAIMQGYWRNKSLTKKTIIGDWLITDDIGKFDKDGYVVLIGRQKDIINIGGLKFFPQEIEKTIMKFKGISDVVVLTCDAQEDIISTKIKALYVSDQNLSLEDLKQFCVDNLEPYKVPSTFKLVKKIPKTSSGKIIRKNHS